MYIYLIVFNMTTFRINKHIQLSMNPRDCTSIHTKIINSRGNEL